MNSDLHFVETLLAWRAAGHQAVLATVVTTWGASPRPVGSMMAIRDDGATVGSLSGGCIDEDLTARIRAGEIAHDLPISIAYGTTRTEAERFGLPCGGRMEILVESLREEDGLLPIHAALKQRRTCVRTLVLATGKVEVVATGLHFLWDQQRLSRRFGPAWRLLLIGATDLTRHVIHCAAHLDYEIVVCDPREDPRTAWNLHNEAHAWVVDTRMPDDVVAELADDERTAVVALSHDPRIDDMALMQALTGRSFYIGAIGSPRTSEKRRERLRSLGVLPGEVARLHAPVGVAIGSRTPAEIAISILAEITAVRRQLEAHATQRAECAA